MSSQVKKQEAGDERCVLPAWKLGLGEAEHFAVLPGADPATLLGILVHGEALHLLESPRPLAGRRFLQAHLLGVQREYGKLGRREATCNASILEGGEFF